MPKRKRNRFIDDEAEHSGDEVSRGSADQDSEAVAAEELEMLRNFLNDDTSVSAAAAPAPGDIERLQLSPPPQELYDLLPQAGGADEAGGSLDPAAPEGTLVDWKNLNDTDDYDADPETGERISNFKVRYKTMRITYPRCPLEPRQVMLMYVERFLARGLLGSESDDNYVVVAREAHEMEPRFPGDCPYHLHIALKLKKDPQWKRSDVLDIGGRVPHPEQANQNPYWHANILKMDSEKGWLNYLRKNPVGELACWGVNVNQVFEMCDCYECRHPRSYHLDFRHCESVRDVGFRPWTLRWHFAHI